MPYDMNHPDYYDEAKLNKELDRVFDICHGCRLCFNLCPSFPDLFDRIDDKHDGEVAKLDQTDRKSVVDLCYQCKLCFPKCPYTPPHNFDLDFPELMLRAKAVRAKKEGIGLREKFLANVDLVGAVSSFFAPIVNFVNSLKPMRRVLHFVLGIHWQKYLPKFHFVTFKKWLAKQTQKAGKREVVFFYTCNVNLNEPEIGKATALVLGKNQIAFSCPEQNCCGMPFLDSGDIDSARKKAKTNIKNLLPYVERGIPIVVPTPTCSYTIKKEWPLLVPGEATKKIANLTFDLFEYLAKLESEGGLNKDFKKGLGTIGYHQPCHLKAQNIGLKSRDILKLIPGTEVKVVEQCSGHDGTWAMKKEFFNTSLKIANKLKNKMEKTDSQTYSSDCALASHHVKQAGLNSKPVHPVVLLAQAYGEDDWKN